MSESLASLMRDRRMREENRFRSSTRDDQVGRLFNFSIQRFKKNAEMQMNDLIKDTTVSISQIEEYVNALNKSKEFFSYAVFQEQNKPADEKIKFMYNVARSYVDVDDLKYLDKEKEVLLEMLSEMKDQADIDLLLKRVQDYVNDVKSKSSFTSYFTVMGCKDDVCLVCTEEIGENCFMLPFVKSDGRFVCGHRFHKPCINQWVVVQKRANKIPKCPACKTVIQPATINEIEDLKIGLSVYGYNLRKKEDERILSPPAAPAAPEDSEPILPTNVDFDYEFTAEDFGLLASPANVNLDQEFTAEDFGLLVGIDTEAGVSSMNLYQAEHNLFSLIELNQVDAVRDYLAARPQMHVDALHIYPDPEDFYTREMFPLHFTVGVGYVEMFELLMQHANSPNVNEIVNDSGELPIHLMGYNTSLSDENVRQMLDSLIVRHEADVNAKSRDEVGNSLIHIATRYRRPSLIAMLVDRYEANPNVQNNEGETALFLAVKFGFVDCVRVLLDRPVDVNLRDTYNARTPLHEAELVEIAELLVNRGADIKALDTYRASPLYYAVEKNNVELARWLLSHGADVNTVGESLMRNAIVNDNVEMVRLLRTVPMTGIDRSGLRFRSDEMEELVYGLSR